MAGGSDHRLAWLAWLETERRYGANTLAAYAGDLDDYRIFTGGGDCAAPDRRAFRGWLAEMNERGLVTQHHRAARFGAAQLLPVLWAHRQAGDQRSGMASRPPSAKIGSQAGVRGRGARAVGRNLPAARR